MLVSYFPIFPPSAVSSLYWKFRFRRQTVNLKAEWVYKIGLLSLNAPNSFYASLIRLIIVPARNSNSHIIIFYWLDLPEPGGGSFWWRNGISMHAMFFFSISILIFHFSPFKYSKLRQIVVQVNVTKYSKYLSAPSKFLKPLYKKS